MSILPPGTLLQLMYLRERLQLRKPGRFIEIGPGSGEITNLLLELGWKGESYDLEGYTVTALKSRFANQITEKSYIPINADFLLAAIPEGKADLVISSMVMEHLEDNIQNDFLSKAANCLKHDGVIINLVPASPAHWGIEDDIAGHYRRYTKENISELASTIDWKLVHISGLTFPVSNILLPVSNFLVNRSERSKLTLSALERTKQSGRRNVKFKTHLPYFFKIMINKYTLFPLHLMQKFFGKSKRSLVIYFELQRDFI